MEGQEMKCFKCKKELVEKKREDVGKWIWVTMICVNPNCTAHYAQTEAQNIQRERPPWALEGYGRAVQDIQGI